MPILYTNRPSVSANFNAAVGSRIGASPSLELLLFRGTTFIDSNADWNAGTHSNTQASSGSLNLINAANPGTWISKVYDHALYQAFLDLTAGWNVAGGTMTFQARTGTNPSLDSLAWNTITPKSILGLPAGEFSQYRVLMNPAGSVNQWVDYLQMESWYAPRLDPLAGVLGMGDISQRVERLINEFTTDIGVAKVANNTGWWNYDGAYTDLVGTNLTKMSRTAGSVGTAGTYSLWYYGTQINSWLNFADAVWDTYTPTSFNIIQEGAGTTAFGSGTYVTTAGTSTGTLHDDPTIGPFIGTAGLYLKWAANHPGTCGILIDTNVVINALSYGNMSFYMLVGSQGPGAPAIHYFLTEQTATPPARGTTYGAGTITNANLPTGTWTRFSIPFTTTNAAFFPRFQIQQLGTHYLELAIAGLQVTFGTPFTTNTNGTYLQPFRPPTDGMFVHGNNYHLRGTVTNNGQYAGLLSGLTMSVGTIVDGQRTSIYCGPFFSPRYVFNERVAVWAGYKYGWNGTGWGTQEFIPVYSGFLDEVNYTDKGDALLKFRDVAKLLKNTTAEKVTQQFGTATGTWYVNQPVHYLVSQLVAGAAWGTNSIGTIDRVQIRPVEIGTAALLGGTAPAGAAAGCLYENRGTQWFGTFVGTSNNGTLFIGVANELYQAVDPFTTWTKLGTMTSNWSVTRVYGLWNAGGVCVGAQGGGGSYGLWSQRTGTVAMTLIAQFGSMLPAAYGIARHAVRRGTLDAFLYVDVDPDGGGGTRIGVFNAGPDIGATPALYKSFKSNASVTDTNLFNLADIGFCGTSLLDYFVTAGPYLFNIGGAGTFGTLGTLNGGTFLNDLALNFHPLTSQISLLYKQSGTHYFGLYAAGSMYQGIGTYAVNGGNKIIYWSALEAVYPYRTWWYGTTGLIENAWTGTFGTIAPAYANTGQFGYVYAPDGTTRLLYPDRVSGTTTIKSFKEWLTPRVGTANWGARDLASIIGELAESVAFVTFVDEMGKFTFKERIGTFGTTGTLAAADWHSYTVKYSEVQGLSPLYNRLTFALFSQAGSTVVQDAPSIGTYGTHALNLTNIWFGDYDDGSKQAIMGQYLQRYRYPKRIFEGEIRYDPRRYIDELVKNVIPALNLSLDQTWRILEVQHSPITSKTRLIMREES